LTGEGAAPQSLAPLSFVLSPLRGARTNGFRDPTRSFKCASRTDQVDLEGN
jgi:hypothetical protein